ncbi:hypothetical protein [Halorussus salinus]|uniref:hypothetical protein n=1 Tax=Halorussus salinus TaxID=1364935 RepID=UPI00138F29FB|nr:hypothetical protein [Halorussus salinus]
MTRQHAANHLATILGVTLAVYAVWSMLLNPATGPLPGTVVPIVVGLVVLTVGVASLAWGSYRTYAEQ